MAVRLRNVAGLALLSTVAYAKSSFPVDPGSGTGGVTITGTVQSYCDATYVSSVEVYADTAARRGLQTELRVRTDQIQKGTALQSSGDFRRRRCPGCPLIPGTCETDCTEVTGQPLKVTALGPVVDSIDSTRIVTQVSCGNDSLLLTAALRQVAPGSGEYYWKTRGYTGPTDTNTLWRPRVELRVVLFVPTVDFKASWADQQSGHAASTVAQKKLQAPSPTFTELPYHPPQPEVYPSSGPASRVTLIFETEPEGATCHCKADKAWGFSGNQVVPPTVFTIRKTPDKIELPTGVFSNVYCQCILQEGTKCRTLPLIASGYSGGNTNGRITRNSTVKRSFEQFSRFPGDSGDCRVIDQRRCSTDSDCVPYKDFICCAGVHLGGQICLRKDADFAGIDRSRQDSCAMGNRSCPGVPPTPPEPLPCQCIEGSCEVKEAVTPLR